MTSGFITMDCMVLDILRMSVAISRGELHSDQNVNSVRESMKDMVMGNSVSKKSGSVGQWE